MPTGYGLGKAGWVTIPVAGVGGDDAEVLHDFVEESYRTIAPKKLIKELDAHHDAGADGEAPTDVHVAELLQHPVRVRARSASDSASPADGDIGSTAPSAAAASSSTSGRHRARRLTSTARWAAPNRPESNAAPSVDANVWASAPRSSASSGGTASGGTVITASASTRADVRGVSSGTCSVTHRATGPAATAARASRVASVRCRMRRRHHDVGRQPQSSLDHGQHPLVLEHRPFGDDVLPGRGRRGGARRPRIGFGWGEPVGRRAGDEAGATGRRTGRHRGEHPLRG